MKNFILILPKWKAETTQVSKQNVSNNKTTTVEQLTNTRPIRNDKSRHYQFMTVKIV